MDDIQRLRARRHGFKSGITKLLSKIEEITSIELERVHSESVSETQRLTASTILAQLKAKWDQIVELDTAIAVKIQTAEELKEETCNANTYQSTLEERIAFLTEYIRKATQLPSAPPILWRRHGHWSLQQVTRITLMILQTL